MNVDAILRDACGARFTCAVVRVERRGRLAYEAAFGSLDDVSHASAEVTTRFDLASLTKVFVAAAALRAVADGAVDLDAPLVDAFPEWRDRAHAAITLRMLLAHTSGMRSGADYRTLLDCNVERFALTSDLIAAPGERVVYSDLGFIALGALLARVHGASLTHALAGTLSALGTNATAFRPSARETDAIPATECDDWRGRVRGAVHDEKAFLMHGVAGHAGLFGDARDVARLAEVFLAAACGRDEGVLPATLARSAIAEHGPDTVLRRGLGWALKTSDDNSCGARMSAHTFGHTGFTGTCVWADPERDLSVVLLTNAVYYGRRDLRDVRAAVCDAAVAEFA